MRITIYYTHRFEGCPGGIETFSLEGPGPYRVYFDATDDDHWALAVSKKDVYEVPDADWHVVDALFEVAAPGLVGFRKWLGENVDSIDVDGSVFWENPALAEELASKRGETTLFMHSSGAEGKEKETETEGGAR